MIEEVKRRNRRTRYGDRFAVVRRSPDELKSIQDCTEEILFTVVDAYNTSATTRDPEVIQANRGALYDRVEAILKRAQGLPPEDDPGS